MESDIKTSDRLFKSMTSYGKKTIEFAKHLPAVINRHTSQSIMYVTKTIGMDDDKFQAFLSTVKQQTSRLCTEFGFDMKPHLDVHNIERLLHLFAIHALKSKNSQDRFYMKTKTATVSQIYFLASVSDKIELEENQSVIASDKGFFTALLWDALVINADGEPLPVNDDEKRVQSWNQRLDEKQILKKNGPHETWSIYEGSRSRSIQLKAADIETDILRTYNGGNDDDNQSTMTTDTSVWSSESNVEMDDHLDDTVVESKHKKKHGLLKSITKLLRIRKPSPTKCTKTELDRNHSASEQHGSNSTKQSKSRDSNITVANHVTPSAGSSNKNHNSIEEAVYKKDRIDEDTTEVQDHPSPQANDDETLVLHIPANIRKIVLVKNGHRVSVEI